jgi:AcrR family transcriptional regulator
VKGATPRTKPADVRRTDLLDAAEELVLQQGADGFTVEDVTTGAGVAKGTFYLHFTNKANLLDALRDRYVRRFAEAQLAEAHKHEGAARVQAWMRAGVAEYRRDTRLHDVLFHPTSRGESTAPNTVVDSLADILAELDRPPPDPQTTATILYAAMHGIADHILHAPDSAERMLTGLDDLVRSVLA